MRTDNEPKTGDLRIWWIPQLPMKAFEVSVSGLAEADLLLSTLADYDLFQYENKVKPDYCNAGGLVEYDAKTGAWYDWECSDSLDGFDEVRRDPARLASAIEARRAETRSGSVEDESAVSEAETPAGTPGNQEHA